MAKGAFAGLFCWALCELRPIIRMLLAACIVLLVATLEEGYSLAIVMATLMLLRSRDEKTWAHFLIGLFLAVLALIKFTYFIQVTWAIGVVTGYVAVRRRWSALSSLVVGYGGGLIGCWTLAGQSFSHFVPFVRNSLAIATAYNSGMFTPTTNTTILRNSSNNSVRAILVSRRKNAPYFRIGFRPCDSVFFVETRLYAMGPRIEVFLLFPGAFACRLAALEQPGPSQPIGFGHYFGRTRLGWDWPNLSSTQHRASSVRGVVESISLRLPYSDRLSRSRPGALLLVVAGERRIVLAET
jgi:hypothetical protein